MFSGVWLISRTAKSTKQKEKKKCLIKNLLRNFCCGVCLLSSDAIIYLTISEVKNPVCISRFIFYIIPVHFPNSFVNYCGYFGYFSHYMCIYIYTCAHTYTHTQRSSVPKFTCHIWYHWAGFSPWSLQRKKKWMGITWTALAMSSHFLRGVVICDGFDFRGLVNQTHQITKGNHSFAKELLQMS